MAEYRIIPRVEDEHTHECDLPWDPSGYGSTGFEDRTVVQCARCLNYWFAAPNYTSLGPTQLWKRVRWYHWRLRKEHGLTMEWGGY